MLAQFLPKIDNEIWKQRADLLLGVRKNTVVLFGDDWTEKSLWKLCGYVANDINSNILNQESLQDDRKKAYFLAVVQTLDFDRVSNLNKYLENLNTLLNSPNKKSFSDPEEKPSSEELSELLLDLGFQGSNTSILLQKIEVLGDKEEEQFMKELHDLSNLYFDLSLEFLSVSASLLSIHAEKSIYEFENFEETMARLVDDPLNVNPDEWVAVFRYLGQSFYGFDAEVMGWAVDFLMNFETDEEVFQRKIDHLLFIVATHLAFYDFENMLQEVQDILFERNFWSALTMGVPIEKAVKKTLAVQPLLHYYLARSFTLSENIFKNKQMIYFDILRKENKLTVEQFLNNYLAFSQGNDFDGYLQTQYVNSVLKENKLPAGLSQYLHFLLRIYLHLREADLVDYKGMLSEDGIVEGYNWQTLLEKDLTEAELKEIKEYLKMIERPTRVKMNMIVAFQKVHWKEEPYLHRVLALNEIFGEAYHPMWSPLVYFDETSGEWKLNKYLPDAWGFATGSPETEEE